MRKGFNKSSSARLLTMNDRDKMVSIEEALEIVLNSVIPLGYEDVPIIEAFNRVLYEDIISDIMIPPVDDSAMDGYAVIADDTYGASEIHPVKLQVIGEIQAGGSSIGKQVSKGTAIRIMTGAPIPEGADSVVKFEDAEEEGGYVKMFRETDKYVNYKTAGEHIKEGDRVLSKGTRLNSADVGILASLNYSTVKVFKQATVSIISTGDEIVDIGQETKVGHIRNSNAYALYSEVKKYNGLPSYFGIVKDTLSDMGDVFTKALKSDVVISSGGVSTGKYDLVKEAYSDLGVDIQFERVNVKPGRPCVFGRKDNKLIFGLPGNPVPAMTSFIQLVRPVILRLMGLAKIKKPIVNAVLEESIKSVKIHHLLRGHFTIRNNEFYVSTTGNQKPSMLRSMSLANCLIVIPKNITRVEAGEKVMIQLINHEEI